MRSILKFVGFAAVVFALVAIPNSPAQVVPYGIPAADIVPLSAAVQAVDTDIAIWVEYVGTDTANPATVAVDAATGDIAFVSGGGADATVSPAALAATCGAVPGTVDMTNATNYGLVFDCISISTNWRVALGSVFRTDGTNTAGGGSLLTIGATNARIAGGLGLAKDTSVGPAVPAIFEVTANLTADSLFHTDGTPLGLDAYYPSFPRVKRIANEERTARPFSDRTTVFLLGNENLTDGGGMGNQTLSCVVPGNGAPGENVRLITTVPDAASAAWGTINQFIAYGVSCQGGKLLYRVATASAALATTPGIYATGFAYTKQGGR